MNVRRTKTFSRLTAGLLLAAVVFCELLAIRAYLSGGPAIIDLRHVAGAALSFAAWRLLDGNVKAAMFRTAIVFLIPCFGLIVAAITFVPRQKSNDDSLIDLYGRYTQFEVEDYEVERIATLRESVHAITDLQALQDVISSGDDRAKIEAIRELSLSPDRRSVEILTRALSDAKQSVKTLAASALGKIEGHFAEKIIRLAERLSEDPENLALYAAIGGNMLKQAGLNERGSEAAGYYVSRARVYVETGLARFPDAAVLLVQLSEIERLADNPGAALDAANRALAVNPSDKDALFAHAQAAFENGDFELLRKDCIRLRSFDNPQHEPVEALEGW